MNKKSVIISILGIILASFGLLWFLQGAGVVHIKPILCVSNCEELKGQSLQWVIFGAAFFVVGIVIARIGVRHKNQ